VFKDVIARRYAKALFQGQPTLERMLLIQRDLVNLVARLDSVPALRVLLHNPGFTPDEKMSVLTRMSEEGGWQGETRDFLRLLVRRNRFRFLKEVVQALAHLIDEAQGRKRVRILTAKALKNEEKGLIRNRMRSIIGQEVEVHLEVDPRLIGGMSVQVGSLVFDGSLR
jgi:F-type H+-transporting ATPase subunit delta